MIKVIGPDAWDLGPERLSRVKYARAGLRGHDYTAFVKKAGHELADWVRQNPPLPGEPLIHLVALGCEEKYGSNRNHDSYDLAGLRGTYKTFEKYARLFRNHQNKSPEKSYGVVKKAYLNEPMGRVELIVGLNGTKEAAERNRGLVADRELDRLESGRDIAVSQSIKISWDECRGCGNKARHRSEYCTPKQCVKYGGCRDNLGKNFDDGFRLYVNNPNGKFFDISDVSDTRGADRTAFVTGKVAADAAWDVGGAELAERLGVVAPDHTLEPNVLAAIKQARELAAHQHRAAARYAGKSASWEEVCWTRNVGNVPRFAKESAARLQQLSDLAAAGVILPPTLWLSAVTGVEPAKCAAFWGDTPVSPEDLLSHQDPVGVVEASAMPAPILENVLPLVKYAGTVESEGRLASLLAYSRAGVTKRASATTPERRKQAAALYVAYQAHCLAGEKSQNLVLRREEACRHNLTLPA